MEPNSPLKLFYISPKNLNDKLFSKLGFTPKSFGKNKLKKRDSFLNVCKQRKRKKIILNVCKKE